MGSNIGNIICLFSTKGGTGRTTIAANLAVAFGIQGRRAVLVDFDLQSGAVDQVLGIVPDKSIADLIKSEGRYDVSDYLTVFTENVSVLAAPIRPDLTLKLDSAIATEILTNLKHSFDFVIVDLPATFAGHVLATLEAADFIGLLVANDALSVKNAVFTLQNLALLGYQLQTLRLIINQFDWRGLTIEEVKQAVGIPIFWRIDQDKSFIDALNKAKPFILDKPKSAASVSLKRLALALAIEFGRVRMHK